VRMARRSKAGPTPSRITSAGFATITDASHANLPHLFFRHPNREPACVVDRPTCGHRHAQRRQNGIARAADVPDLNRNRGHPSYCLAVRPPEAQFAGRDHDVASLPNRQPPGHHGGRVVSRFGLHPYPHPLMHQPSSFPLPVLSRRQIHRHASLTMPDVIEQLLAGDIYIRAPGEPFQ